MALPRGEARGDPEQLASQYRVQGSSTRRPACLCCHLVTHSGTSSRSCHLGQFHRPPDIQNFTIHLASNLQVEVELPGENT